MKYHHYILLCLIFNSLQLSAMSPVIKVKESRERASSQPIDIPPSPTLRNVLSAKDVETIANKLKEHTLLEGKECDNLMDYSGLLAKKINEDEDLRLKNKVKSLLLIDPVLVTKEEKAAIEILKNLLRQIKFKDQCSDLHDDLQNIESESSSDSDDDEQDDILETTEKK